MLVMAAKTFGKFSQEEEKQNQDFSEKEKKLAPKMEKIFNILLGVLGRQSFCESAAKFEAGVESNSGAIT